MWVFACVTIVGSFSRTTYLCMAMFKIEEFIKDRLQMNYFVNNQRHVFTTQQLKALLENFLTVYQRYQDETQPSSNRAVQLKRVGRPTNKDAARKPKGGH